MKIGTVSTVAGGPHAELDRFVDEAKRAESAGFSFLSVPNIFGHDAITTLAIAGRETERIELATGVVPTPPRHPHALAQQALTAGAACNGRFTLGIGLSHKLVIEDMLGLSYGKPAKQMREYLEVLMPILRGEQAQVKGDFYNVNAGVQIPDAKPVPVLVAALGPLMLKVAGELADGTATWMTGVKTLGDHTVPHITKAAAEAGRPAPRILASLPIAITNDPAKAIETANQMFAIYGTLPSYRAMLDREGAANPGDVALVGDAETVRAGLGRLRDAGVTDMAASVFPADEGAVARTLDFLRDEL
ncbi:MAG: LLM class F420-dependent oxidoreductase [Proteobacteria bacterium]|nr:LLM class F420-dependent oxidoreductase [Pseudomonadota bacterium]